MARFWGISRVKYRGSWQWLAQHRNGGKRLWKSGFADELAAARWLATKLRVTVNSLQRASDYSVSTSRFTGVIPRQASPRRPTRWIAQAHGKYLGIFCTELAAAKAVAKALKTSAALLSKKRKSGRRGVSGQISAARARTVFMAAYPCFKTYVAGDYQSLLDMESNYAREFKQDTALR